MVQFFRTIIIKQQIDKQVNAMLMW